MSHFNILLAERTEAILGLAQSSILRHCTDIRLEVAAGRKQIKNILSHFSPDLIIVSENLEMSSKKLIKWLNSHPALSSRHYVKAKTENFKRLIPPEHINSSFSLHGISYWVIIATKAPEKRRLERFDTQENCTMTYGSKTINGKLINIAEGGALCLFPRNSCCPPIAEKVLIDIGQTKNSIVYGAPGFPVRIQAVKPKLHCKTIHIAIKFFDLSKKQVARLNSYIQSQSPHKKQVIN